MTLRQDWTRRAFLQKVGVVAPTVKLMLTGDTGEGVEVEGARPIDSIKFAPIDLSSHFTASPSDFGTREKAKMLGGASRQDGLIRTPSGTQNFRGMPFLLGPEGSQSKSWIVLSRHVEPWVAKTVDIAVNQKAGCLCLAQFCDWDANETPAADQEVCEQVGQRLADVVFVFEDGQEEALPIRRRFEVNAPWVEWGHLSFAALAQTADSARQLTDPLSHATGWGHLQMGIMDNSYSTPLVWISALANPYPEKTIKSLRFEAASNDPLIICGLTLFLGRGNPLRYERLTTYRITLPGPASEEERWELAADLGVVARKWFPTRFEPESWLKAPDPGLGSRAQQIPGNRYLYAEITASSAATLWLRDTKSGVSYAFDLDAAKPGSELAPRGSTATSARVEVLEREKVWLHGQVIDQATGRPTPVRLAFRSTDGRYVPPYGHRAEINDGWFQDYGADVKVMDSSFAYVDGSFQVELPVGDVYLEMTKGFEYGPVRRRLEIRPEQRELKLEIERIANLRSQGWVSADTHVHFLSPTTALLEAGAEGLNLVNLLAAQWGDLFTNVGDITNEPLLSCDRENMVWVGSENRQHILGHIGLLGPRSPIFPMSAAGPDESYLGDPLWNSMAHWSDACRTAGGLSIAVHFPYPTGEIAADVALGKIDAVELWPQGPSGAQPGHFNFLRFLDWYRYLNCGYRLPAVGGTDKMGAYMPVGTNRAYAYIGQQEFTFTNWAKAVRSGNTFVTSGPLLLFQADGHAPGQEINLGAGGGTIEVHASAQSFVPFHRLEIVLNGRVVASRDAASGTREMTLTEKIHVPGPGWLAARCSSQLGPVTSWEFMVQAHTSPVYLIVPRQELFSPATAAYMLALIDGSQVFVENLAIRPDPERLAATRKVLDDARAVLHRRLHEHNVPH
ncbi:MAG: hypothetical protein DMG27_11670 [Acidobacteria bacterium]|nr:MAG: hypothetical protein DMG27_11670 [Acidobacteriota bacterium]